MLVDRCEEDQGIQGYPPVAPCVQRECNDEELCEIDAQLRTSRGCQIQSRERRLCFAPFAVSSLMITFPLPAPRSGRSSPFPRRDSTIEI